MPIGTARRELKRRSRDRVELIWLVENEMLQSFTHLQLDGFIALWRLHKPQAMNDSIPVSVKPRAPLHVRESRFRQSRAPLRRREILIRQTPSASLLPRSPSPSLRHALRLCLSVAAKPVFRAPACLSPRSPFPSTSPFAFLSPQSLGPVPHRFHAASVVSLQGQVYNYRDRYWRVR